MTTLDTIRDALPDYARDLKLNLGSVLSPAGAPGLTERQIWAVALGAAEASRNPAFATAIGELAAAHLDAAYQTGARAAAAIMGMNNVYYRFLHLVEDPEYGQYARAVADERHRQSGNRQGRFRARLAGGLGHQRLRHLRGLPRAPGAPTRPAAGGGAERRSHRRHSACGGPGTG